MSNEKEQKPTVLEANMAFDASPALFESIMDEGPIKYGPDDSGIDMITTPEGDEVVDPRSIMDVNVDAPVQSGAMFNSTVDPISVEEGDQYMSQFQDYIENVHKQEITDDDIDVAGATIQMLNDTRQDVAGYIKQQIKDAADRLSKQNVNPAQPDGVAADMTGDDRIPSGGTEGVDGAGMEPGMEPGMEGEPDLGDSGLAELDTTTHLTPEEDVGADAGLGDMGGEPDLGLDGLDAGTEAPAEPGAEPGAEPDLGLPAEGGEGAAPESSEEPSTEDNYDPFSDLDLGDEGDGGEGASEESAPASEEPASEGDESEAPSASEEDLPGVVDEGGEGGEGEGEGEGDEEETDKKPLTESVHRKNFRACLESVINNYEHIRKKHVAQAKCEAIVKAANQKILAESIQQKRLKAQCESIVSAYRQATGNARLKAQLESIVSKYNTQKMVAESVAPQKKAVLDNDVRLAKMKAQCESIIQDFHKAESTANAAKAIIDGYKQQLA